MDLAVAAGFPFEALSDALAIVDEEGLIWPRNEKMRALLRSLGSASAAAAQFGALPIESDEAERLVAGEPVAIAIGGKLHELQCCSTEGTKWLVARDRSWPERAAAAQLAAARVRMVGGLAGTIVHDLANLLGAGLGLAEIIRPLVRDPADSKCLDELARGARHGAVLGRAVARMLTNGPRARTVVLVGTLVEEAVLLLGKSAQRRGTAITVCHEAPPIAIRVAPEAALQALLAGFMFCIDRGASAIVVEGDCPRQPVAAGRERSTVRIRVHGAPLGPDAVRDALLVVAGQPGLLAALDRLGETGPGLLHAKVAMACAGGELLASQTETGLALDFVWPTVRGSCL